MMKRLDITEDLVHFIKGAELADAFTTLQKILRERRMLGGTGFIRGQYPCVCFSEAPVGYLGYALTQPTLHPVRYQPIGLIVAKSWLFDHGGRPIIYQNGAEFSELPEHLRWRHVRYEPNAHPPIDFTWEREWRIRTENLPIDPSCITIVLPTREIVDSLLRIHEQDQDYLSLQYVQIFDEITAWQLRDDFEWNFVILQDIDADVRHLTNGCTGVGTASRVRFAHQHQLPAR